MFTAKHYIQIAEVIHQTRLKLDTTQGLEAMGEFTHQLIQAFKKDNPKFNQFKFIEAANKDLIGSA
jgi:hypothetical protein